MCADVCPKMSELQFGNAPQLLHNNCGLENVWRCEQWKIHLSPEQGRKKITLNFIPLRSGQMIVKVYMFGNIVCTINHGFLATSTQKLLPGSFPGCVLPVFRQQLPCAGTGARCSIQERTEELRGSTRSFVCGRHSSLSSSSSLLPS